MTLMNGLVAGGSALLWCDTAYFDGATGKLLCHDTKAFQGLEWPWAGITACLGGNPHDLARDVGNAWPKDVPALLEATADALRAYAAQGYQARVLLAAYQDRPQLWLIGTDDVGGDGPFVPTEVLHFLAFGNHLPAYDRALRRGFGPKDMHAVIDAQIAEPFELAGTFAASGKRRWIGGNVVEIEVTREGVDSRVVRAVGEPVVEAA